METLQCVLTSQLLSLLLTESRASISIDSLEHHGVFEYRRTALVFGLVFEAER